MQYVTKCVVTLAQALIMALLPILLYHKQATTPLKAICIYVPRTKFLYAFRWGIQYFNSCNMISCIEVTKQLDVVCTVYTYIHVYIIHQLPNVPHFSGTNLLYVRHLL